MGLGPEPWREGAAAQCTLGGGGGCPRHSRRRGVREGSPSHSGRRGRLPKALQGRLGGGNNGRQKPTLRNPGVFLIFLIIFSRFGLNILMIIKNPRVFLIFLIFLIVLISMGGQKD